MLGFVARRLELEPVVLLFAVRSGVDARIDPAGLAVLDLAGLEEPAAAELLDATLRISLPSSAGGCSRKRPAIRSRSGSCRMRSPAT